VWAESTDGTASDAILGKVSDLVVKKVDKRIRAAYVNLRHAALLNHAPNRYIIWN
jgi:hypothetical protein